MDFQKYFSKLIIKDRRKKYSDEDYLFKTELEKIIGTQIENLEIYKEAFSLKTSSKLKNKKNYERLEFLGDSVLGTIISCYLFEKYPHSNEGFLTQMKSKIVNRKNLNILGDELKLQNLIRNNKNLILSENLSGNLLEALIGSIYIDFSYQLCHKIVLERLLKPKDIDKLENKIISYKGLLFEWSQKKKLNICYETCEEIHVNNLVFRSYVILNDEKISNATESSKKKAEEKAAQRAFYILNKKENIVENQKIFS